MRSLDELKQQAMTAFNWQSMNPEARGASFIADYEATLNADLALLNQEQVPDEEIEKYNDTFVGKVAGILSSEARCASPMVTGGSNFNHRSNSKRIDAAHNKSMAFEEWRNKALKGIVRRFKQADDNASVQETIKYVTRMSEDKAWYSAQYIKSHLERKACNGDIEAVNAGIAVLKEFEAKGKPVVTNRSGIWKLPEVAQKWADKNKALTESGDVTVELPECKVVANRSEDRLQLFFDDKPEREMINDLKHAAFRWSSKNKAWQRQLTDAALRAGDRLLHTDELTKQINLR